MSNRHIGTVKWFNVEKGYGFITPEDASGDVFVHHTGIEQDGFRRLDEGQHVEFSVIESERGLIAQQVRTLA
ncbi:MAG TPA: cold shock domain-containing protein [Enteractinococcus sp.]